MRYRCPKCKSESVSVELSLAFNIDYEDHPYTGVELAVARMCNPEDPKYLVEVSPAETDYAQCERADCDYSGQLQDFNPELT